MNQIKLESDIMNISTKPEDIDSPEAILHYCDEYPNSGQNRAAAKLIRKLLSTELLVEQIDLPSLIYKHTGLSAQQSPGEYGEVFSLCKDILTTPPTSAVVKQSLPTENSAPQATVEPLTDEFMTAAKLFAEAHIASDEMDAAEDINLDSISDEEHLAADARYNSTKKALVVAYKALAATHPTNKATVPQAVIDALDRMCTPLDASRLSGATAEEDARCMQIIRDHVMATSKATCPDCKGKGGFQESDGCEGYVGVMCEPCNGTGLATSKEDTGDLAAALEVLTELYEECGDTRGRCTGGYLNDMCRKAISLLKSAAPSTAEPKGAVIEMLECRIGLLQEALAAVCADARAIYEATKSGKPLAISIGQWGRLHRAETRIGSATPSTIKADSRQDSPGSGNQDVLSLTIKAEPTGEQL